MPVPSTAPDQTRPSPPLPGWRLDHALIAVLFGVMVLVPLANVLGRYVFHYSLAFTEELTINIFVWLTVLGIGVAFERGAQLGMTTVAHRLSPRRQRQLVITGAVLATLLFAAVDVCLLQLVWQEMTLFRAKSASLGVPLWLYYSITVACTPWVFRGIWRGVRTAGLAPMPEGH